MKRTNYVYNKKTNELGVVKRISAEGIFVIFDNKEVEKRVPNTHLILVDPNKINDVVKRVSNKKEYKFLQGKRVDLMIQDARFGK